MSALVNQRPPFFSGAFARGQERVRLTGDLTCDLLFHSAIQMSSRCRLRAEGERGKEDSESAGGSVRKRADDCER